MLTITDDNQIMPFGKYKGKTVEYILDNDPSYIIWLADGVAEVDAGILDCAMQIDAENSPPESYFYEPD